MFLAIIIPPARKERLILMIILVCFALSYAASRLPVISNVSSGTRIIVLTVVISSLCALIFPVKDEEDAMKNES